MSLLPIRGKNYDIRGYYEQKPNGDVYVFDKDNKLVGKVKDTGTYNKKGKRLSNRKDMMLLIDKING